MEIRVPQLAEGITNGNVVSVLVSVGDEVAPEQNLLELETEKAVAPLPSPSGGKVSEVLVSEGDEVAVGQVVLHLDSELATEESSNSKPEQAKKETKEDQPEQGEEEASAKEPDSAGKESESSTDLPSGISPPASPSLRKMCRQLGLDLTRVRGTGRGGRISTEDVRAHLKSLQEQVFGKQEEPKPPAQKAAQEEFDFSAFGSIERKPLSSLRKTISQKMSHAWSTIPHVSQFDEACVDGVFALREQYKEHYEERGARLTITSLLIYSTLKVLKKYPVFNASIDQARSELIYKDYMNIGLAVETEDGLIVPVIREADTLSVYDLTLRIQELAGKARDRSLSHDELQGASFTVSNQGGIGGTHFTPIVNPPQAAVLGLGQSREKPVVRDKEIARSILLPLSLSYDHRLIDGASAARFISSLVEEIEGYSEDSLKLEQ